MACALVAGTASVGCHRKAAADGQEAADLPVLTAASTNLQLTWVDDKGEFHVEQQVDKVPESARELVRVVDPSREPPLDGRVLVADLRTAKPDGSFPVRWAPREEFEAIAVGRREKLGIALSARPADGRSPAAVAAQARPTVIIYGASWCGPCHQAQAYLKSKNITFVEKDIEKEPSAGHEMQAKLAKVGRHGGSIPVLDVRGHILVGFDPGTVDRALAAPPVNL